MSTVDTVDTPRRPGGRAGRPVVAALAALLGLLAVAGCAAAPPPATPAAPVAPVAQTPAAAAAQPRVLRFDHRATQPVDAGVLPVARGETVRIVLTSDVVEEAHLHGYDRTAALTPGGTAVVEFTADLPGEFELELHGSGARLATLQVR